jgi:hypothetical protein
VEGIGGSLSPLGAQASVQLLPVPGHLAGPAAGYAAGNRIGGRVTSKHLPVPPPATRTLSSRPAATFGPVGIGSIFRVSRGARRGAMRISAATMQKHLTRVGLAILVAAGIGLAVWRMAPPAARIAPPEPARVAQPTSPPRAAVEARPVTLASVPRTISASSDYPAQAVTLASRANAGDARAQHKLAERMRQCGPVLRLAERGDLSAMAEAEACRGLPDGDWQVWRDKAIAAGDPVALLYAASESKDPAQDVTACNNPHRERSLPLSSERYASFQPYWFRS